MTKIISFYNEKGGTCKTTLTNNFAAGLSSKKMGKKVLVLDLDPQRGLSVLRTAELKQNTSFNEDHIYKMLQCSMEEAVALLNDLTVFAVKYDVIIVDFPGNASTKGIGDVLALIEYFIVPCEPCSPLEIAPTFAIINTLKKVQEYRKKKKLKTHITGIISPVLGNEGMQDAVEMFKVAGIPCMVNYMKWLKYYKQLSTLSTILDSKDKKVESNFRSISREVSQFINL